MVALNSRGSMRKCMASMKMHLNKWNCNSICRKIGNASTGTTLSMLQIYSRCLICILKVKSTEFKVSYFTTVSSAYQPAWCKTRYHL